MCYSPEHLVVIGALTSTLLAPTTAPYANGGVVTPSTVCDADVPSLPPSITIEKGLEPIVQWTLENSPTFRQQCRVLAGAAELTATVRVTARTPESTERALSAVRRLPSGRIDVTIEIRSSSSLSELLGHEFEHVIEQLDGVNLRQLQSSGEARKIESGAFETRRAIHAGQRVSAEVLDNSEDRVKRAAGRVWRALTRFK
jgi:hypothetical protein